MSGLKEKVRKIIKKTSRFLMWTTVSLAVLLICLFFAFRSPACQTWMSQKAANYLSDELKTKVSIEGVNIQFFTSVVLEGIYVEDLHGDTILYAPDFVVNLSNFSYGNKYLKVESITLTNATVKLKKYNGEKGLSFRFIQQYFASSDTTTSPKDPSPWKVDLGAIKIENAHFAFIDTRWDDVDRGVDYENIRISELFVTLERLEPMEDSTSLFLSELKAREMSGLTISHMESRVMIADTFIKFNDLILQTPGSDVKGFIGFHFNSFEDIEDDFIHRVKMVGHFSESIVEMGDIAYFSPVLLGIQKKVMLTCDVSGTVEKLKTRNVDLRFGKSSRVAGNFSFDGLPDIDNTDMHFRFKEATTNYEDLTGIPIAPFNDTTFLEVPSRLGLLGNMYFSGTLEGFTHDFVAHGKLKTAQGNMVLDNLTMSKDSAADDYNWYGSVTAQEFNIGVYLGVADMGRISGTTNITGYGTDLLSMVAEIDGNFSAFDFNGYRYTNITVREGLLAKEAFEGKLNMDDPNVRMTYDGYVDFSTSVPKLDFWAHLDSANFSALGFADTAMHLIVSTDMRFAMQGNDIDNLRGSISLNDIKFSKRNTVYTLNAMTLISAENSGISQMSLLSDIVNVNVSGEFELLNLPNAITDVMSGYLPAFFPPRQLPIGNKEVKTQYLSWTANFLRNTEAIDAFVPGLHIASGTYCEGRFDQANRTFHIFGRSDSLAYESYAFKNVNKVEATGAGGKAILAVSIDRAQVTDTLGFSNIAINSDAGSNILNSTLSWDNRSAAKNAGTIKSSLVFESKQSMKLNVMQAEFYVNDSSWVVDPTNFVRKDSSSIWINNFVFHSGSQSVGVNGRISNRPNDHLNVKLDNFNLSSLNYVTQAEGVTIAGYLSGETVLSDLYNAPKFTGNTEFKGLFLNKEKIGDGTVDAFWKNDIEAVYVNGKFSKGIPDPVTGQVINNIGFDGDYYPKREENSLDMHAHLDKIPLGIIQPLLADFCSMVNGHAGGDLAIKGNFAKPLITGELQLSIRKIVVDYLGIELANSHPQTMIIEENAFAFEDFKISDNQRDTCYIYGHIFHDNFKKFQFDMDFAFEHFQVLNTTVEDNEDYYGKVYATGFMNIFGFVDEVISIDIKAKTDKVIRNGQPVSSDFNIPMTTTNEVGDNGYIMFESESQKKDSNNLVVKSMFNNNGIDLSLNLEATTDAVVHVIFDETVGDELSARGTGDLRMHIAPSGDFTMFGAYVVDRGDYLFTLKNIVYAPFELVKGGVISWTGDPADAHIDADAVYSANASVLPFFPFDTANALYQQSYPVSVIMQLDSNLVNPALSFDIELSTADQNIQETVKSYTQTDLEMNRQVLSLMVLNSFMTPAEFREGGEGANAGGATSTLLSNFVSGTLNNWLSQISENANVKLKYRPNEDMSLQELKLYLGTQVWNNRITIDAAGSIVNASQTQAQGGYNQYVDVNVEYKVTENGKVRLRAFNRGNENSALGQGAQHTQGAGIFYREEFESFGELLQQIKAVMKSDNPNRVKKEQPPVIVPDAPAPVDTLRVN